MHMNNFKIRSAPLPTIAVLFTIFLFTTTVFAFSDLDSNHRYAEAINFIEENNIVQGYPDGTFKPDIKINRAELLKIIIESKFAANEIDQFDRPIQVGFDDVPYNIWFAPYVRLAKAKGIIKGYPDGTFKPEQKVNFVEALKIVMKSYDIKYNENTMPWYYDLVHKASGLNLIPLDISYFSTKITRSQMADMITRVIKYHDGALDNYLGSAKDVRQTYQDIFENVNKMDHFVYRTPLIADFTEPQIEPEIEQQPQPESESEPEPQPEPQPEIIFPKPNAPLTNIEGYQPKILSANTSYNLTTGTINSTESDIQYELYSNGPNFRRFHKSFPTNPNSNAGITYMGNGQLSEFDCPTFELEQMGHDREGDYQYFEWWNQYLPIQIDGVYCVVNYDNSKYFRLRVDSINPDNVGIQYQYLGDTGVKTYGCRDNLCDDHVETFCIGCTSEDISFLEKAKEIQNQAKICLDNYLGMSIPGQLKQVIRPNSLSPCEGSYNCDNYGHGGPHVNVWGYQGIMYPGDTRVTDIGNLRLDLHENMHVYTRLALSIRLPGWFDEGMSIQTNTRVHCGNSQFESGFRIGTGEYEKLRDGIISYVANYDSAHTKGSLFFKGLEVDYSCSEECAANIWRRLATEHTDKYAEVTNAEIKVAVDLEVGQDTSALFNLLQISY